MTSDEHAPVLDQAFDASSLSALRASLRAFALRAGMPADRATDVVIALHELAANAVRHGAGSGRLQIWDRVGTLHCHVDDNGRAVNAAAKGNLADGWSREAGHGLWLAGQIADQLTLSSDQHGTRAVITFSL